MGAMAPPLSRGQPGGRLPRFPLAPMSRVTPSFTRKSSLPKIPHAAGKCKKGQNDAGVRGINHLVHKNCLITGKMWKSTYYSEWRTLRACAESGGASRGAENFMLPLAAENAKILHTAIPTTLLHIKQPLYQ